MVGLRVGIIGILYKPNIVRDELYIMFEMEHWEQITELNCTTGGSEKGGARDCKAVLRIPAD